MNKDDRFTELDHLIDSLAAGSLSEAEDDRLEEIVASDLEARRRYLERMFLIGQLQYRARRAAGPGKANSLGFGSSISRNSSPVLSFLGSAIHRIANSPLATTSLVAIACYGTFALLVWSLQFRELPRETDNGNVTVAMISNTTDVKWSAGNESKAETPTIELGEPLEINAGVVELQLERGAKLLVEGPARWSIDGDNRATLHAGKLVANVPRIAAGFTLDTPTARIVDLGTEFGVAVGAEGDADIHVVKGKVEVHSTSSSGQIARSTLETNQSAHVDVEGTTSESSGVIAEKFSHLLRPKKQRPPADSDYEVIFHYRLGDDDEDSKVGGIAAERTIGRGTEGFRHPLARVGQPNLIGETGFASSQRALSISGGDAAEGYIGDGFDKLPIDNFVLELWVRARSAKSSMIAYVGHSSFNGYGLLIHNGKWSGLCGSLDMVSDLEPLRLNEWTHLAGVRENGRSQLWVNGTPTSPIYLLAPKLPEPIVRIGHASQNVPDTFDGDVDEVRLLRLKRLFRPEMLLRDERAPRTEVR